MSDWQVGDLAVCVDARGSLNIGEGRTYTVAEVSHIAGHPNAWSLEMGRADIALQLSGVVCERPLGFHPDRFRKILPDKHEECEPEFVTLLKRIKIGVSA